MKNIVFAFLLLSQTLIAQNHCTTPATVAPGVECNLLSTAAGLLMPCSAPIGLYNLPIGTNLLIDDSLASCVSFCQQGIYSDIYCATVVGGVDVQMCAGSTQFIGQPGDPGATYDWQPGFYINCNNCPFAGINPPSDAIYMQTTTQPGGAVTVTFYNIDVITCTAADETAAPAPQLFPVPARDEIEVRGLAFDRFEIYDQAGRVLRRGVSRGEAKIRFGVIPGGVYYLRLWSGELAVMKKLVVEE